MLGIEVNSENDDDDISVSGGAYTPGSPAGSTLGNTPPQSDDEATDTSMPPSPTLRNLSISAPSIPLQVRTLDDAAIITPKRGFSERVTNTPHSSPQKKRTRVQALSSVRVGLEISTGGEELGRKPRGLLQYFKKGSSVETSEYWAKQVELGEEEREKIEYVAKALENQKRFDHREGARLRKQKQRQRLKEAEIHRGVRSPGGRKRKVCPKISLFRLSITSRMTSRSPR